MSTEAASPLVIGYYTPREYLEKYYKGYYKCA